MNRLFCIHTLFMIALFLMTALSALAQPLYTIDFEREASETYKLDGAKIVGGAGSAINGGRSLLASFDNEDTQWHEFLTTSEQVKFVPGNTYHVSFRYKILDPGSKKTQFYSLLRSRSGAGKDKMGEFWLWNRERGAEGTIHRLFKIDDKNDWMFIIGVRHTGSILIDDVQISKCETDVPGYGIPIKPGSKGLLKIKGELDKMRQEDNMQQTLADMLIVWCDEGSFNKISDHRAEYASQLNPDFVDWSSCGPLAKDFGVRTAVGGPEYQEYYKFEGEQVWNDRYKLFGNSGFAVSLDNTYIQDETWGEGGYFTCQNGANWHQWFTQELIKKNQPFTGMCQDNIGCATFYKGHGCFCEPCLNLFRIWLKSRYTSTELTKFGITDIDTFKYTDRVYKYGLIGNGAINDPITREYIKFQFCSQLADWADVVKAVKLDSRKRGYPVPCYGNQIGAFGMWPFAVAIGEFCDIIQLEQCIGVKNNIPNWSKAYKMGRASGHESKPVWIRGPVGDNTKNNTPFLSPLFWQANFAEALANGGVRDISFGINAPYTGDPTTLDYIDSPEVRQVWKEYSDLCDGNRAVFTHRKSLANVALAYSLPSTMFRRYAPLDIEDTKYFSPFDEAGWWLDSLQIPYDCVVLGHSEVFPTAMEQLKQYKVLVLPSVDALSDIQLAFLKEFTANGGKIIKIGDLGTKDENLNTRKNAKISAGVSIIDATKDKTKATAAILSAVPVKMDAPKKVQANLWLSADGSSVDLHLVNYGADLKTNTWDAMKPFTATVTLPKGFIFNTARMIQFVKDPVVLKYKTDGNKVTVTVPPFEAYAVISFADQSKLDAANQQAKARREQDKAMVKRIANTKNLH